MVRIGRLVIICLMASRTGIWSIGISVGMALGTIGNGCMCTGKRIRIGMVKGGWNPCSLRMTAFTSFGKLRSSVVWLGCLIVISRMTSEACFGRIGIITVVTGCAIVGYSDMSTCQSVIIIMDWETSGLPAWICRMAGCTCVWNIKCFVVRIS